MEDKLKYPIGKFEWVEEPSPKQLNKAIRILVKFPKKLRLAIPREREVDIFLNFPTKLPKQVSDIKGNLIYADKVRLLDDADLKWWDKAMPKMTKTPFQGSHMFPFEKPEELAREINGILGDAKLN